MSTWFYRIALIGMAVMYMSVIDNNSFAGSSTIRPVKIIKPVKTTGNSTEIPKPIVDDKPIKPDNINKDSVSRNSPAPGKKTAKKQPRKM